MIIDQKMNDILPLPKPETKIAAKVLIEQGYSSRKVQEVLGIDDVTALRYSKEPTPEELKHFEAIFANRIKEQKEKGVSLVHQRLLELIPKERRIDQVVKAGEFLEGKNQGAGVLVNNQVNTIVFSDFKNDTESK